MNNCYKTKLESLIKETDYKIAFNQFTDSFPKLRSNERILQYREYMIDDAIFFNDKRNKLLILVLQRKYGDPDYFGFGRVVIGLKNIKGEWDFALDREYLFDKKWYNLYKQNEFENISKISRYFVLKEGDRRDSDCDIDENFWFGKEK